MQIIDVIFIALIALMLIHGFIKGFIGELFSWAALVLSIWVAVLLFPAGGAFIRTRVMENVRIVPELLAFVAIFLLIMIVIKLLERIFRNVVEGARLGGLNKFLGAVFGIVEGIAITTLIIFVLNVQPLFDATALLEGSIFGQFILPIIRGPLERGHDIINTAFFVLPGRTASGV